MIPMYPMFVDLAETPVLVVGGGTVAARKARALVRCGAVVTVVALDACEEIRAMADSSMLNLQVREFRVEDLDGKRLAIAATNSDGVNEAVAQRCRSLGVWLNAVDDPARCDFHAPSVIERGAVQVAVSTSGTAPALGRKLKEEIGSMLEPSLGAYAELVSEARRRIREGLFDRSSEERACAMEAVLATDARQRFASGDAEGARRVIMDLLELMPSDGRDDDARS